MAKHWTHPLAAWPKDVETWARFLSEVEERIRLARSEGGSNGGAWQTFDEPLPEGQPPRLLPVGPVMTWAHNARDARGRYCRRTA
jgi:hypothetical protein